MLGGLVEFLQVLAEESTEEALLMHKDGAFVGRDVDVKMARRHLRRGEEQGGLC